MLSCSFSLSPTQRVSWRARLFITNVNFHILASSKTSFRAEHFADMARFKYSPMKKKAGPSAGIPRASGERNSPVGNGALPHNQVRLFACAASPSHHCQRCTRIASHPCAWRVLSHPAMQSDLSEIMRLGWIAALAPICASAFTEIITTQLSPQLLTHVSG